MLWGGLYLHQEEFRPDHLTGQLMFTFLTALTQMGRDTITDHIRDNLQKLAKAGRWLGAPLLVMKIRLKHQGVLSFPFSSVCSSRKCFPALSTPMPTYAPHTVWVTIWVRPKSQSFERSAEKHWHYPFRARWRHISSRCSTLVLIRCQ